MTKQFDPAAIKRFNETGMVGTQKLTKDGFVETSNIKIEAQKLLDFVTKENQTILNLKNRWMDEREYEDFAEYRKIITKTLEEAGYTVKSVSKSFAITVVICGRDLTLKVGARSVSIAI